MATKKLIRIVQLTLHPEKAEEFLALFEDVASRIRSFDGCDYLELLQHASYPNIFSTYSHWRSADDLEAYRNSELFKATWKKTKTMFAAPPIANSYFKSRSFA